MSDKCFKLYVSFGFLVVTGTLVGVLSALSPVADGASEGALVLKGTNTVSLNLPVTGESVRDVQMELLAVSNKLPSSEPIYLVLNSPGGSIEDGALLIETAKGLKNKVHTISMFSASMSFIISQYLDTRYALNASTLMSHHAYIDGLSGEIPGSALTRLNFLGSKLQEMEEFVAKRSGQTHTAYMAQVQNELWMSGQQARTKGFVDEVAVVKCDRSLQGSYKKRIRIFMFEVEVEFSRCPLIVEPIDFHQVDGTLSINDKNRISEFFHLMFKDRNTFHKTYIQSGLINTVMR